MCFSLCRYGMTPKASGGRPQQGIPLRHKGQLSPDPKRKIKFLIWYIREDVRQKRCQDCVAGCTKKARVRQAGNLTGRERRLKKWERSFPPPLFLGLQDIHTSTQQDGERELPLLLLYKYQARGQRRRRQQQQQRPDCPRPPHRRRRLLHLWPDAIGQPRKSGSFPPLPP